MCRGWKHGRSSGTNVSSEGLPRSSVFLLLNQIIRRATIKPALKADVQGEVVNLGEEEEKQMKCHTSV